MYAKRDFEINVKPGKIVNTFVATSNTNMTKRSLDLGTFTTDDTIAFVVGAEDKYNNLVNLTSLNDFNYKVVSNNNGKLTTM